MFFVIQLLTGVLLLIYYSPTPETAHESIEFITTQVPFGWLIRSLHSWSANLMIACVLIHFFSVYLMKAYRRPREIMWFSGSALLFIVLGFGFTGYLLPWDTVAYFATQIGTEIPRSIPIIGDFLVNIIRGGEYIAEESLRRMFALHAIILPLVSIVLILFHVAVNQIHGTSAPINAKLKGPGIPFYPDFIFRDMIAWLMGITILISVTLLFPVTVGPKADPLASAPVGIKPEWYFLTLYQTLRFVPPVVFGISGEVVVNILVMLAAVGIILVPVIDKHASRNEPSQIFSLIGIVAILYIVVSISLAYLT